MDDRGVSGCVFFGVFFDASLMLPWSALDACPACGQRPGFGPAADRLSCRAARKSAKKRAQMPATPALRSGATCVVAVRSGEDTSELQSPCNILCRLLLVKKK